MTAQSVAAVVVRWRGGREVDLCLGSLLQYGGPRLTRIVLVDSGSGDGGAERLRTTFPDVEILGLPENHSFAWAANRGAESSDEPLLLLLNPDTRVGPGAVDALTASLDRHDGAAGAVPRLVSPDGVSQHRWQLRRLPGARRLALGVAGHPQFPARYPDVNRPVEQPAASAWLVRRAVWNALGGLDPVFRPAWWEDVDFCARLAAAVERSEIGATEGFVTVFDSEVVHRGGSSLADLGETAFLKAYHRNLLRYAERHHPTRLGLIRTGLRMSLAARALVRPSQRAAYLATIRTLRSES